MPQRFLRPGITTSDRWNRVGFRAQSLYIRILTIVDDYGRCDGRASVIHGHCFSVWNENNQDREITPQETLALLNALAAQFLVDVYEVDGKKVMQVTQWQERIRDGAKEKWPANPIPQDSAAERSKAPPSSTTTTTTTSPPPPPISNRGPDVALNGKLTSNGARALDLMARCKTVLGESEVKKCHRRWSQRAVAEPDKLERVLSDMEEHVKNGGTYTKSAGARAEDLWGQFE